LPKVRLAYQLTNANWADDKKIMDVVVIQKVLPKIHGSSDQIETLTEELLTLAKETGWLLCEEKLEGMKKQLETTQYTSFF
jgi:hypothetical protein